MTDYAHLQAEVEPLTRREPASVLHALWDSTRDPHHRFGFQPETLAQHDLIREEMTEVINASLSGMADHTVHEAVDCIVVLIGLVMAHGRTMHDLEHAMQAVIVKNDSKTSATHAVDPDTHKIRRRV